LAHQLPLVRSRCWRDRATVEGNTPMVRVNEIRTMVRQRHRAQGGDEPLTTLRELRLTRGWTQLQVATAAQVSRRTVARLESRVAGRVSVSVLIRVAAVFGESLSTLFPELLDVPQSRPKKVS